MSALSPPAPPAAPTHILRTHSSAVSALFVSSDNERIYSGDASGLVVVTSTRSLRSITAWNAHTDSLLGIEEWGECIITHARDNKLHVWTRVEELPTSARLGGSNAQSAATDVPKPTLSFSMDVNALNYCRFSLLPLPEGALVAIPNLVDSTSADIWSLPACERIHAAIGQAGKTSIFNSDPTERSKTDTSALPSSSASSQSSHSQELRLICAYESGSVTLRRYTRIDKAKSVEGAGWEVIWDTKLHVESIMAMRVSHANDFALSVSADHLIGRYDLTSTKPEDCSVHRTKHPGNGAIAIRNDGRVCAVAGWDGSIRLYATRTLRPLGTLRYHKTGCQAVDFASLLPVASPSTSTSDSLLHQDRNTLVDTRLANKDDNEDSADEMDDEERAGRARWLVCGGKDGRVSIWELISFEKT
ncbi:hypothetical protein DXG03_008605 [Asterophora parasitica]|uniref:ASTRA-associated protein 1 n=1 Tax=Asterophora parasitica TaxID=117018 RepID=A0A9P7GBW1_9AGAR|nr:hypothetical protein DXG03_008605 [Asterophora parasitica]